MTRFLYIYVLSAGSIVLTKAQTLLAYRMCYSRAKNTKDAGLVINTGIKYTDALENATNAGYNTVQEPVIIAWLISAHAKEKTTVTI
jgi:hypothetical protein